MYSSRRSNHGDEHQSQEKSFFGGQKEAGEGDVTGSGEASGVVL